METKTINKEQMHDLNDLQEKLGTAFHFQQAALRLKDIVTERHCSSIIIFRANTNAIFF